MPKPSNAQAKIIDRINEGARLSLDVKTGRYIITEIGGKVCQIDQRPVLVMIRDGLLHQSLGGECRMVR
ncbi:MAG: hypothetical protein CVV05_01435 [Gammaproteobacteria bacterium HGW-Gammaproteobacteria-1]|jgi:hypothetical protein|nr:MAG: hypothetical protein CVV05_01435 [Gammaproteobacteria bacterium HGW-Gammaproteobacteria-1]